VPGGWWQWQCAVDEAQLDAVVTLLELCGAQSVSFAPLPVADGACSRVSALFPTETDLARLDAALAPVLPEARARSARIDSIADRDWIGEYHRASEPIPVARRLWVGPSRCAAPPGVIYVKIDPGLAFGTGRHPTTALCLAWLASRESLAGKRVIDYGCGSGVLAISAALLGSRDVLAVDNDPQALAVARANAELNGVAGRIAFAAPEAARSSAADILIANILLNQLCELAHTFATLVAPGGDVVLSGIMADQIGSCHAAYAPWFDFKPEQTREDWVMLHGRRRAAA
jgi:ribosomal protein L11 methyltransferase